MRKETKKKSSSSENELWLAEQYEKDAPQLSAKLDQSTTVN